jgi:hypothetical protein
MSARAAQRDIFVADLGRNLQWVQVGNGGWFGSEALAPLVWNTYFMPLPTDVVGELAKYLVSRGLDGDPENIGNQGAFLLGKASDAAVRAPGLRTEQAIGPRQGIAATTFYDQIKAFVAAYSDVLRG